MSAARPLRRAAALLRSSRAGATRPPRPAALPATPQVQAELVEHLCRLHQQMTQAQQDVGGGRALSQSQRMVLLLLDAEAVAGGISQKVVAARLQALHRLSHSAASKILRELARPPLALISQRESAHAGREKTLCLTEAGRRALTRAGDGGSPALTTALGRVSDEGLRQGLRFFEELFGVL